MDDLGRRNVSNRQSCQEPKVTDSHRTAGGNMKYLGTDSNTGGQRDIGVVFPRWIVIHNKSSVGLSFALSKRDLEHYCLKKEKVSFSHFRSLEAGIPELVDWLHDAKNQHPTNWSTMDGFYSQTSSRSKFPSEVSRYMPIPELKWVSEERKASLFSFKESSWKILVTLMLL